MQVDGSDMPRRDGPRQQRNHDSSDEGDSHISDDTSSTATRARYSNIPNNHGRQGANADDIRDECSGDVGVGRRVAGRGTRGRSDSVRRSRRRRGAMRRAAAAGGSGQRAEDLKTYDPKVIGKHPRFVLRTLHDTQLRSS